MTAQSRGRIHPDGDLASVVPSVTTDTVFIDPASRLGVSVNDPGDERTAIQSVGRILSEIVPRDSRPALKTKIIEKALASPPQFGTVGELSEALAAFEQLHGRELIQAVYERWKKADVTARVTSNSPNTTLSLPSSDSRSTSSIRLGSQPLGAVSRCHRRRNLDGGHQCRVSDAWTARRGQHHTNTGRQTTTAGTLPLLEARPIAPVTTGLLTWSVARAERPAMSMSPLPVVDAKPPAPTTPSPSVGRIERPAPSPPGPAIARDESPVVSDPPVPRPTGHPPSPAPQLMGRAEVDTTSVSGTSDVVRTSDVIRSSRWCSHRDLATGDGTRQERHRRRQGPSATASRRSVTYSARDGDVAPPIPVLPRLLAGLQPLLPRSSSGRVRDRSCGGTGRNRVLGYGGEPASKHE